MDIVEPLPCIICGKTLESAVPQMVTTYTNQPYAGTTFISYGHYGSTIFDPMSGGHEFLEITICDPCVRKAADQHRVVHGRKNPTVTYTYDREFPWLGE